MEETVTLSTEEWNIIASTLSIDVSRSEDTGRFSEEYEDKIMAIVRKIDHRAG